MRQAPQRKRSPLAIAALAVVVAAGVIAAIALGGDDTPTPRDAAVTPTPTPTATATATPTAAPTEPTIAKEITVGRRPNVVRVAGDKVFVGSFLNERMQMVSRKSGKVLAYAPRVGKGVNDAVVSGHFIWLAVSRAKQLVRLDTRTGRPVGTPLKMPYPPSAIAVTSDAIWTVLLPGGGLPDQLVKIDRKTGKTVITAPYPNGIKALTASPGAIWVAARRRAFFQRVDPATGLGGGEIRVSRSRTEDIVYRKGLLWLAIPDDNAIYKYKIATNERIPISVGSHPSQLAATDDTVYVTNYNSSDLSVIDAKSSRVIGDPLPLSANPFSLAVDGKYVWVGSQPENKLTKVLTGRGG